MPANNVRHGTRPQPLQGLAIRLLAPPTRRMEWTVVAAGKIHSIAQAEKDQTACFR
jgi:hypothetical protein